MALATLLLGAPSVFEQDVDLRLAGGKPNDLVLSLGYRDDQWHQQVEGWAFKYWVAPCDRLYNTMDHHGEIQESTGNQLTIAMTIRDDPWIPGGPAAYTLDLKKDKDKFTGTFTGQFKGQDVEGEVAGNMRAKPWPT